MQASKYLKIGTCPASQNLFAYMWKIKFSVEISKYSLALQPETLVNTSGRVLFSSPAMFILTLCNLGNRAATCNFQHCGILTNVDSDEPVQPHFKLRNSKWCSVSSLTVIEYLSGLQRLWSGCVYAQAGLSLCWSHIPQCWKSHVAAQFHYVICWIFKSIFLKKMFQDRIPPECQTVCIQTRSDILMSLI